MGPQGSRTLCSSQPNREFARAPTRIFVWSDLSPGGRSGGWDRSIWEERIPSVRSSREDCSGATGIFLPPGLPSSGQCIITSPSNARHGRTTSLVIKKFESLHKKGSYVGSPAILSNQLEDPIVHFVQVMAYKIINLLLRTYC